MTRLVRTVVELLVVACFAIACGGGASNTAGTATTAPKPPASATPTTSASAEYPKTVRDLLGRQVTIKSKPARVVTTSPSAIEMLYAAGGTAVARSSTATFLPGTDKLTDIGPSYQPAFEKILAERPDLVVADASAQGHLVKTFDASLQSVPIVFVGALKYADIGASIRLLGDVVGASASAKKAADDIDAVSVKVQGAAKAAKAARTLVLVAGQDGGMSAALNDSFIGDLVRIAGGENTAAALSQAGQVPGYSLVSLESVVKDDPDVILVIVPGNIPGPSIASSIAKQFPNLAASKNNRIKEIDLEVYLQAPGPRAALGLTNLLKLLHPEISLS